MHQAQGARQARIGEAGHHARLLACGTQDVPQQQNHQQLEQAIHHRFAPARTVERLVEQPFQGPGQGRDFIEFEHQVIRQRRRQGIACTAVEIQGRADQLRAGRFRREQTMSIGPGEKDQGRLAQLQVRLIAHLEQQLARLKQVQMTAGLLAIEGGGAAKRTAMESAGIDAKVCEQGGQAIHDKAPEGSSGRCVAYPRRFAPNKPATLPNISSVPSAYRASHHGVSP
ncbi:hypothetical protein D3C84_759560 [compost metagenome]